MADTLETDIATVINEPDSWARAIWPLAALVVLVGLFLAQSRFEGPWTTGLLLLVVIVPLGAFWIYLATLRRILAFSAYSDDSLVRRFLPGTWLRIIFGWVVAMIAAIVMAVRMIGFGWMDWLMLALSIPVFMVTWRYTRQPVRREFKPYYRTGRSIWVAVWFASLVLVGLDAAIRVGGRGVPEYGSLGDAIAAGKAGAALFGNSAIAAALTWVGGIWNGLESYALGLVSAGGGPASIGAIALTAVLAWPLYFTVCMFLASFLVPLQAYARVLAPLADRDLAPAVPRGRIFWAATLTTLLLLGVYPTILLVAETTFRDRPELRDLMTRTQLVVERIDNTYVREGTLGEIKSAELAISLRREATIVELERALDAGFDGMLANVDTYLDWYYSLPAEYGRIGHFLIGNLEGYVAAKVEETLGAGDPFGRFETVLEQAMGADSAAQAEYRQATEAIIARNRVEPGRDARRVSVATYTDMDSLMIFRSHTGVLSLNERLGTGLVAGGTAGIVSGIVAGKVVAKLVAKGSIKVGAKALAKVAAGKASGVGAAAVGAAAGAAIGSVLPIVGTVAGAAIGGVVAGLGVGAGTEYLMLELEEAYGRETHKAEIEAAINAMRDEARATLESRAEIR